MMNTKSPWGEISEAEIAQALKGDVKAVATPPSDRRFGWSIKVNGKLQRVFGEDRGEIDHIAPQVVASYVADNPSELEIKWEVCEAYLIDRQSHDVLKREIDHLNDQIEGMEYELKEVMDRADD